MIAPLLASVLALSTPFAPSRPPSQHEYLRQLEVLCKPEWAGRLTLADGEVRAAAYIAGEFAKFGLKPGGTNGFFHEFDVTVNQRPTRLNLLEIRQGDRRTLLGLGSEFNPMIGSSEAIVRAPMVFAGYGLATGAWNDYAGLDVAGKVVVVMRGQPEGTTGRAPTNTVKARTAKDQGAVGIVFVGPQVQGGLELGLVTRVNAIPQNLNLSAFAVSPEALRKATGFDVRAWAAAKQPGGKDLGAEFRGFAGLEPNRGKSLNVIGVLPGKDPVLKDETIIIGAHFDHLGYGEVGSRTGNEIMHLGADDNASGTAGLLVLAQRLAQQGGNRRTIIFQTYSGEEVGLVGSTAWVRENTEGLKNASLMLNMDMIGRLREEKLTVFGATAATEMPGILDQVSVPGVKLDRVAEIPPNSDHAPFSRAGVPAIFLHTGLHDEYHTEKDTIATINLAGAVKTLQVAEQILARVDAMPKLTFNPAAVPSGRRAGDAQGRRVRVGFLPEMSSTGPGLTLQGVGQGSPAEKAGFRSGDVILRVEAIEINSMEDLQRALMQAQAGRVIKVTFRRGTDVRTVDVTPEAPAAPTGG